MRMMAPSPPFAGSLSSSDGEEEHLLRHSPMLRRGVRDAEQDEANAKKEEERPYLTCELDQDPFSCLSFEEVASVLAFASLPERAYFAQTCRQQKRLREDGLDATLKVLSQTAGHDLKGLFHWSMEASPYWLADLEVVRRSKALQLSRLVNVHTLDLGDIGNDEFLRLLSGTGGAGAVQQEAGGEHLPQLATLRIVGSDYVTDEGILALAQQPEGDGEQLRTKLRLLDITFCPRISYGAILKLRKLLPNPLVVRRQPEWLDGHFETPFNASGESVELHTYFPDGSFTFGRSEQAAGYVMSLFRWSTLSSNGEEELDHLGDKLQYVDFTADHWPTWTRYAYRPGVSLLRVPDEVVVNEKSGKEEVVRSVMVAQTRKGFRPPSRFPRREHIDMVPLGSSRFFSDGGQLLGEEQPDDDAGQIIMISRMKVRPLASTEMIPPKSLTDRIETFVAGMMSAEIPINGEDVVHAVLGGLEALEETNTTDRN